MMRRIVFWGATGQAKVLAELCSRLNVEIAALFDRDARVPSPIAGVSIYHGIEGFNAWRASNPGEYDFAVAIGGGGGRDRLHIHDFLVAAGLKPATLIHPRAYIAENATVGLGSQILVHAAVCSEARLGRECIVNTAASVDHECHLGDGVHIGPGAHLAGLVTVGDGTFVGAGSTVMPRVQIGADCVIGAGSVVTRDIPDRSVAWGVPATVRRNV